MASSSEHSFIYIISDVNIEFCIYSSVFTSSESRIMVPRSSTYKR